MHSRSIPERHANIIHKSSTICYVSRNILSILLIPPESSCSKAASVFEKSADADIIPRGQFISENEVPKWRDKMGQVEL